MKTVLIISSFVSASHVGAGNSAFCLQRLGCETAILPTTLFGRHPGWGPPGGTRTPTDLLRSIWDGINAQNLKIDAVMTGYMGQVEHISLACEIIKTLRLKNPSLEVYVDPVMGDGPSHSQNLYALESGRLYIQEAVATALIQELLPLASFTTPNVWELCYIKNHTVSALEITNHSTSGHGPETLNSICEIANQCLPCDSLITSVPFNDKIGTMLNLRNRRSDPKDRLESVYVSHKKFARVPNGGGDALAGTFFAHRLNGETPVNALTKSTASIFEILEAANADDLGELPLIRKQNALINPKPLTPQSYPYDR